MSNRAQKESKLLKNTVWFSLGTFLSKAVTFLLVPLYTSILTRAEYSISDIISTTVSLSFPFFSLIISSAVCRFALDKTGDNRKIFSVGLFVILLGLIPLSAISAVAFHFIESVRQYWGYFVAIYALTALTTLESEFLKGLEKVKLLAIVGVVQTLSFVLSNVLFLVGLGMRIEGYLLANVVSHGIAFLLYFSFGRVYRYIINPRAIEKELTSSMMQYSLPLVPNSAMWWITNSSDRYFVSAMVSIADNGLLSVAYKIPSMLSIFVSVFNSAWELSVVEDFDNEKGKSFYNAVYQRYVESCLLVSAFLVVAAKIFGKILYAASFFNAWKFSVLLIIGVTFHSLAGFLGTAFTTAKKTKMVFVSTLVGAVSNLVLNVVLILWLGTVGAVIATVVSYFLTFLIRRVAIKRHIAITGNLKRNILSFAMLLTEAVLMYVDLPASRAVALVLFLVICVLNRSMVQGMLKMVTTKLLRKSRG